jgi:putative aldouronate transport system permease protein
LVRNWIRDYQLYILLLPAIVYILIFAYGPMYGLLIAFKDFRVSIGVWGSPWVGLEHFVRFITAPNFWTIISNTIGVSVYQLAVGFPIPILLAIGINEVSNRLFKKSVQMVTYMPHFISTVVISGMIVLFLDQDRGIINHLISFLGGPRISYMTEPEWFKTIFVFSGIWQHAGFGTIIYLAALSSVDPQQIEAATIDGANRLQKIIHVDLPAIVPVIVILLILDLGTLLSVGFEKALLLQNPLNMESADIIQTYVYRVGLIGGQFGYSTAIGLFNAIINFILLIAANRISRKVNETSLW